MRLQRGAWLVVATSEQEASTVGSVRDICWDRMDTEELDEAIEPRTFEGRATSDLFDELTVALGGFLDGARIRWSGVSVVPLCHISYLVSCLGETILTTSPRADTRGSKRDCRR
mgnify:CR=1 FL=1